MSQTMRTPRVATYKTGKEVYELLATGLVRCVTHKRWVNADRRRRIRKERIAMKEEAIL